LKGTIRIYTEREGWKNTICPSDWERLESSTVEKKKVEKGKTVQKSLETWCGKAKGRHSKDPGEPGGVDPHPWRVPTTIEKGTTLNTRRQGRGLKN